MGKLRWAPSPGPTKPLHSLSRGMENTADIFYLEVGVGGGGGGIVEIQKKISTRISNTALNWARSSVHHLGQYCPLRSWHSYPRFHQPTVFHNFIHPQTEWQSQGLNIQEVPSVPDKDISLTYFPFCDRSLMDHLNVCQVPKVPPFWLLLWKMTFSDQLLPMFSYQRARKKKRESHLSSEPSKCLSGIGRRCPSIWWL